MDFPLAKRKKTSSRGISGTEGSIPPGSVNDPAAFPYLQPIDLWGDDPDFQDASHGHGHHSVLWETQKRGWATRISWPLHIWALMKTWSKHSWSIGLQNVYLWRWSWNKEYTKGISRGQKIITLCPVGADDGHGADPVRRDLGDQGIKNFQAGCIHHQNFRIMPMAQEPPFALRADCELIELHRWERTQIRTHAAFLHFPKPFCCLQEDISPLPSSPGCPCVHRPAWWTRCTSRRSHPTGTSPWNTGTPRGKRDRLPSTWTPSHWEELHWNHLLGIVSSVFRKIQNQLDFPVLLNPHNLLFPVRINYRTCRTSNEQLLPALQYSLIKNFIFKVNQNRICEVLSPSHQIDKFLKTEFGFKSSGKRLLSSEIGPRLKL